MSEFICGVFLLERFVKCTIKKTSQINLVVLSMDNESHIELLQKHFATVPSLIQNNTNDDVINYYLSCIG